MCEIEGDRDSWDAIGREPFLRKPAMGFYPKVARPKFAVEPFDLWLDRTPLERKAEVELRHGLDVEILTGSDLQRAAPYLSPAIIGAERCANEGKVSPILATPALAEGARQGGARILRATELIGTTLRGLRGNLCDRRDALRVPAEMNQRVGWIRAYDSIVFHVDIRRSTVHDRHSKVVVKSEILRPRTQRFLPVVLSRAESQMPFSQDRRSVALVFENIGNGELFGIDNEPGGHWRGPPHALTTVTSERIFPCQKRIT